MTTNADLSTAGGQASERRFRHMLIPSVIFYVVFTGMFVVFYLTLSDEPLGDDLPFLPFLLAIVSYAGDARREWGWRNGIKVVAFITLLALSAAAFYQLALDTVNMAKLMLYPTSAVALMAASYCLSLIGRTAPFQFMGRHLARLGGSKWFQRTVAVLILAGGLAITVYAYWLRNY